jgi:hypothetical protein
MSGTSSTSGPPKPIQAFQAASTGLGDKPTLADAWQVNARNLAQWLVAQKQSGIEQGLIDPNTGWPTQKALIDAAQQYGGALMGSTEGPKGLPRELIPKELSPAVKRAFARFTSDIVPPEATARHARWTSPEGVAYQTELRRKQDLWNTIRTRMYALATHNESMSQAGLTDRQLASMQRQAQWHRDRLDQARQAAKEGGVEYPGTGMPPDERFQIPFGQFPGDEKYAHHSFLPDGYPFQKERHDWHDPKNWAPDYDKKDK